MRVKFYLVICLILNSFAVSAQQRVIENNGTYYFANEVVVKFSSEISSETNLPAEIQEGLKQFGVLGIEQRFNRISSADQKASELKKIFNIKYDSEIDPILLSAKINKLNGIEWAEPHFLYEIFYTPNDPSFGSQYALSKISAAAAWDVTKGDTSVIISIVDTGVDWDHPDLAANIYQNDDPVNGVDDDQNGYIDDIRGWDFGGLTGTPDNDPMEDRPDHGTHVAGIVSAVTDNSIGVASIGYNCRIMPVKTAQDDIRNNQGQALIAYGYEGIVYAADNGAKIINCSWGSFSYSILGQETVDYALSKGSLIVAAAGNDGMSDIIYPAKYDGVLSVGSTTSSDLKSNFSNYGIDLDVTAPGSGIYGTWQNNTYANLSGTSMASPLAAGLAGLVAAQFPNYTPLQIAEQIRVTSDNIDNLNPSYTQRLGFGRINASQAVSTNDAVSVRALNFDIRDEGDGDGIFEPGELVSIGVEFMNYLNPTSSLSITLTGGSNTVINSGTFNAGSAGTLHAFNNETNRFTFTIQNSTSQNQVERFKLEYGDGSYLDFQWFEILLNPSFATQGANKIALTVTGKGTMGFNDYPNNLQGDGFKYDGGSNLVFEGAFLYGNSATGIMDGARIQSVQSTDFSTLVPFTVKIPGTISDQQGQAIFNDDGAGTGKLGVETELNTFTFTDEDNEKFIIFEYTLKNKSSSAIEGLYAGLFFDWDIIDGNGGGDKTSFDATDNFAYAYNTTLGPTTYVGSAVISEPGSNYYGIFNAGNTSSFSIYDNFSEAEKWQAMSSGIANTNMEAGDISFVNSAGPFNIAASQEIKIAFAVAAGDALEDLRLAVQQSKVKYASLITDVKDHSEAVPTEFSLE